MKVEPFIIESEAEADNYLNDLLEELALRSMDEVYLRAHKLIRDENLKQYFINKAKGILAAEALRAERVWPRNARRRRQTRAAVCRKLCFPVRPIWM